MLVRFLTSTRNSKSDTGGDTFGQKGEVVLKPQDLDWIPEKWWKLVTGESGHKTAPNRVGTRSLRSPGVSVFLLRGACGKIINTPRL